MCTGGLRSSWRPPCPPPLRVPTTRARATRRQTRCARAHLARTQARAEAAKKKNESKKAGSSAAALAAAEAKKREAEAGKKKKPKPAYHQAGGKQVGAKARGSDNKYQGE